MEVSGEKRKRSQRSAFTFQARPISKEMLLRLYGISSSRFRRQKDHCEDNGISLRVHGNHGRLPPNVTSQTVNEEVKNFLTNYVEENAVLLPGRIPGFKKEDIKLLSSRKVKNWIPLHELPSKYPYLVLLESNENNCAEKAQLFVILETKMCYLNAKPMASLRHH
ncbi:hypothetical protein P5673_032757 [Acropora cervicornis]|uniref:Uncharacterized protein n=1 Tax=Acropora cervicornis TaxID=6130 RepID=A0AAD9PQS3_ACRCE|nr:hypothetical protein P5673_032757 [Acropora cervicornis]